MDRRRSESYSAAEIGVKHKVTLDEIGEMDLCNDLNLNDVDGFVEETLGLLKDIENGLMVVEDREE